MCQLDKVHGFYSRQQLYPQSSVTTSLPLTIAAIQKKISLGLEAMIDPQQQRLIQSFRYSITAEDVQKLLPENPTYDDVCTLINYVCDSISPYLNQYVAQFGMGDMAFHEEIQLISEEMAEVTKNQNSEKHVSAEYIVLLAQILCVKSMSEQVDVDFTKSAESFLKNSNSRD